MKRKDIELKRLEWRDRNDPQRVVFAALTWYPTDRINGYPARYTAILANVRREVRDTGAIWETGTPYGTWSWTVCELPGGARRSKTLDDKALARFEALVADYLPDYVARHSLSIDADAPALCAP